MRKNPVDLELKFVGEWHPTEGMETVTFHSWTSSAIISYIVIEHLL
jgi:hypothetical protein